MCADQFPFAGIYRRRMFPGIESERVSPEHAHERGKHAAQAAAPGAGGSQTKLVVLYYC